MQLASQLSLKMVSVLPSTIVGQVYGPLSLSMTVLDRVLRGKLATAPDFYFTFVDVRDVAQGMIAASGKGRAGERYLLAGDQPTGIRRLAELAGEASPRARTPRLIPEGTALATAALLEGLARVTGREPAILRSQVRLWYRAAQTYDCGKPRRELGWEPRPSEQALRECFAYLTDQSSVRRGPD